MRRRNLALAIGAAVAVVLGFIALPRVTTTGAGSQVELAVAAIEANAARVGWLREAAWGETHEGSAFDHYVLATTALGAGPITVWWDSGLRRAVSISTRGPLSAEQTRTLRPTWAQALSHMAAGAHRRDAKPHSLHAVSPLRMHWLALVEAGLLLSEKSSHAAIRLWLDDMTFRLDCEEHQMDLFIFWTDAALQELEPAANAELAVGLERLDARLQNVRDPREQFAGLARPLLDGAYSLRDWHWTDVANSWEWGFDPTERHLAAFAELFGRAAQLMPVATPGKAREAQWHALCSAPWSADSALVQHVIEWGMHREKDHRQALTQVRLLQLALAFHRRQPLPALIDPYTGEPLSIELDGDTAEFRAAEGRGQQRRAVRH